MAEDSRQRSMFKPETVGVACGIRLALWTLQKSTGIMEEHRRQNNVAKPEAYSGPVVGGRRGASYSSIADPADPFLGHLVTSLSMAAFAMEILLKRIATITRRDGKALHEHNLLALWRDLPPEIQEELEIGLQRNVSVKVWKKGETRPRTKAPTPLEKVCAANAETFERVRYITAEDHDFIGRTLLDDMNCVIPYLVNWLLEKDGRPAMKFPADDAELKLRYMAPSDKQKRA